MISSANTPSCDAQGAPWRKLWVIAVITILLAGYGFKVATTEMAFAKAPAIILETAPVDPRALLMGDYMTLNYVVSRHIWNELHYISHPFKPESAVLALDEEGLASFSRLYLDDPQEALADNEILVRISPATGEILGTTRFHFQEGAGEALENARYAQVRVMPKGYCMMEHLLDKDRVRIIQQQQ